MERKFLEELGIEKDIIDKVLNQHSSEIGKYKQSADKIAAERDGLRTQLDDASAAMQSYKELDVDGIKKAADEWKAKYEADTAALHHLVFFYALRKRQKTAENKKAAKRSYIARLFGN